MYDINKKLVQMCSITFHGLRSESIQLRSLPFVHFRPGPGADSPDHWVVEVGYPGDEPVEDASHWELSPKGK